MSEGLATLARALKDAFDRSFTEPMQPERAARIDLALIRIGTEPFALRLTEIGGLHAGKVLRRLPGADPALLGLAGFRGAILPVYGLAPLVDRPPEAAPRWLVLAEAAPLAFAFGRFEGHLGVGPDAIQTRGGDAGAGAAPIREFVTAGGSARPLIHVQSLLDTIGRRRPATPTKPAATTGER